MNRIAANHVSLNQGRIIKQLWHFIAQLSFCKITRGIWTVAIDHKMRELRV